MNYSNTGAGQTGQIELYKNTDAVGSWNISSGIPSLNTSNIIIGTTEVEEKRDDLGFDFVTEEDDKFDMDKDFEDI